MEDWYCSGCGWGACAQSIGCNRSLCKRIEKIEEYGDISHYEDEIIYNNPTLVRSLEN